LGVRKAPASEGGRYKDKRKPKRVGPFGGLRVNKPGPYKIKK
jgi:hypothetical protein